MQFDLIRDIIEWDVVNWSKALEFWIKYLKVLGINLKDKKVLDIGSRNGGLSLWAAINGAKVVCSDLDEPTDKAKFLHRKYGVERNIEYKKLDVLNICYPKNSFDFVEFKSVLGALRTKENQQKAIDEIFRVLKTSGVLIFAENLRGSYLHIILRKLFVKWNDYWRYITINEMREYGSKFKYYRYSTAGFLGCFGRSEKQRYFLGKIDSIFDKIIYDKFKYIIYGVAQK